eukprot:gene11967-biopygen9065
MLDGLHTDRDVKGTHVEFTVGVGRRPNSVQAVTVRALKAQPPFFPKPEVPKPKASQTPRLIITRRGAKRSSIIPSQTPEPKRVVSERLPGGESYEGGSERDLPSRSPSPKGRMHDRPSRDRSYTPYEPESMS